MGSNPIRLCPFPTKEEVWSHEERRLCVHRAGDVSTYWGGCLCQARERPQETTAHHALTLAFQPPELWGNLFLLLKIPSLPRSSLWSFVKAATRKQYYPKCQTAYKKFKEFYYTTLLKSYLSKNNKRRTRNSECYCFSPQNVISNSW